MKFQTVNRFAALVFSLLLLLCFPLYASASAEDAAPGPQTYTVEVPLQAAYDDLEELVADGTADDGSNDLEIGVEYPDKENERAQIVGLRFADVPVLHGATITGATIQFTVYAVKYPADPFDVTVTAEDAADAAPFSDGGAIAPYVLSSRLKTVQSVRWASSAENRYSWSKEKQSGKAQRTPDLSTLVQAVVDREDWAYGNAIAFYFTGIGNRTAYAYEKDPDRAAVLTLTFTIENDDQPAPEGLVGIAPTTLFAEDPDGSISGTAKPMEYRPAGDMDAKWMRCKEGVTGGLVSGDYEVRYKAKPCYNAGAAAVVNVPILASDIILQPGADETQMNFTWYTNATRFDESILEIAPASAIMNGIFPQADARRYSCDSVKVNNGLRSNKVTVTGLAPDMEYVYRMGNSDNWSDAFRFTTRDAFNYCAILVGDPQIGASGGMRTDTKGWQATLTGAMTTFPDASFILSVGDHVQSLSKEDEYELFFSPLELRAVPLVATVGNHDDGGPYYNHYNMPNETKYGETVSGGDYWFTYGNTLYMVLNSNNRDEVEHDRFMQHAIDAAGDGFAWKIVLFHHSIYCSASHSLEHSTTVLRNKLYPLMDKYGIDVALMGHDHCYTRSFQMLDNVAQNGLESVVVNPKGTLYITCSSASGSMFYTLKNADEAYRAVRWPEHEASYSCVTVSDGALSVVTYVTATNEIIDSYTIIKDTTAPAGLVGVAPTAADTMDGQISGTTVNMAYRKIGTADWLACADAATPGLVPGTYAVRYIAADGQAESAAVTVTVPGYAQSADGEVLAP